MHTCSCILKMTNTIARVTQARDDHEQKLQQTIRRCQTNESVVPSQSMQWCLSNVQVVDTRKQISVA